MQVQSNQITHQFLDVEKAKQFAKDNNTTVKVWQWVNPETKEPIHKTYIVRASEEAMRRFDDVFDKPKPTKNPSLDNIICAVSHVTGVRLHELLSKRRDKGIVDAKQLYIYIAVESTNQSFTAIAHGINKDHTTILHGYKQAKVKLGDLVWLKKLRQATELMGLPMIA